jgi:hypothetical protein
MIAAPLSPASRPHALLRVWPVERRRHPRVGDDSSTWPGEAENNGPDAGGRSDLPIGKTVSDADVELGPVDYQVVAFPAEKAGFSGERASELKALMD